MTLRSDVSFPSGGQQCAAWLYLPARPALTPSGNATSSPKPPVVVMAHGVGAVRTMRLDAFAERFQAAGYACLVFDYRHFGDSEGMPRQLLDIDEQLEDWSSAISFAEQLAEVDGRKIVLWGTSFGGGHVIASGAKHKQVAAVIAQCPFTDGLASALATSFVSSVRVTGLALLDQLGAWFGAQPLMAATAGKPGAAALMTAPDAEPGYQGLIAPGSSIPLHVAARFALNIVRHFPGRKAKDLACPALFCVCESDSVAPSGATLKHVGKAPKGQVVMYPEGHFEIYVGAAFERVVADQIAFLQRHVPAG